MSANLDKLKRVGVSKKRRTELLEALDNIRARVEAGEIRTLAWVEEHPDGRYTEGTVAIEDSRKFAASLMAP